MNFNYIIGIDISKLTFDVAVFHSGKKIKWMKISNTEKGVFELLKRLGKLENFELSQTIFCMEHTGIYTNPLLKVLETHEAFVWLESGLQIKRSMGLVRGKNDKIDAERIASYAYKNLENIKLWEAPRKIIQRLNGLILLRDRLVKVNKQLNQPINENVGYTDEAIRSETLSNCKASLTALGQDIKKVEKQIKELIDSDDDLRRLNKIISSIYGIGEVISTKLIVMTNEFKAFKTGRQFACYSGIAPFEHSSGTSVRGKTRVSHLANKNAKTMLHMAALSTIRKGGSMREYYERKVEKGKSKISVINAIRNKLVHCVFACVRNDVMYQKNYKVSSI